MGNQNGFHKGLGSVESSRERQQITKTEQVAQRAKRQQMREQKEDCKSRVSLQDEEETVSGKKEKKKRGRRW